MENIKPQSKPSLTNLHWLAGAADAAKTTVAEIPDGPNGKIFVGPMYGDFIWKGTKYPEEAKALLEYGKKLKGIVLEDGSVGSHATVVARAWAIPLVINAKGITREALNGDPILVDGEQGIAHLRPDETVQAAFQCAVRHITPRQSAPRFNSNTACV